MVANETINIINYISDKKNLLITYIEAIHLAKEVVNHLKVYKSINLNLFIEQIKDDPNTNARNFKIISSIFERFISEENQQKIKFDSIKEHLFLYNYITQKENK